MDLSTLSHYDRNITIKEEEIEYVDTNRDEDQVKQEGISVDDFINDLLHSSGENKESVKHQCCKSKGKGKDDQSYLDNNNIHPLFCIKHSTFSNGDINQNNKLENINKFTNMSLSTPSNSKQVYTPGTSKQISTPSTSRQGNLVNFDKNIFEIERNTTVLETPRVIKEENNKKFRRDITNSNIDILETNVKNRFMNLTKDGDGRSILKCTKCNKEFKGSEKHKALYEHWMSHIKDPILDYKMVYLNYKKDKGLILDEDTYDCPICGKQFKSVRSMNAHQGMHTNYKRYTCSKCSAKFKLEADFKIHQYICINDTSNEVSNTYICQECGAVFQSKEIFIQHMNIHTITPILPYKCSLCDIDFELLSGLALHQKLMHTKNNKSEIRKKIISCHECGERFYRQCEKKRHMVYCVESERKQDFQCNQCDMKFRRRDGLQLHKSILHR